MNKYYLYLWRSLAGILLLLCTLPSSTDAQTQTQTKVTKYVHDRIGGYLESLPVDYASNPTKKYPLLVFIHGRYQIGTGSSTDLDKVSDSGVAKLIKDGLFPSSFKVNGEKFSFIVISPQMTNAGTSSSNGNGIVALMDTILANYRVDTNRIYMTGLDDGGGLTKRYARSNANKLSAALAVAATYTENPAGTGIPSSNLPFWSTHRNTDNVIDDVWPQRWTDTINAYTPAPDPLAKLTIFPGSGHNVWDETYDPAFTEEGVNVYEWMLQFTRNKLVAYAGPDQGFTKAASGTTTITLDGSKSHARYGRITGYAWSLISGNGGTSITSSSSATTSVTGLTYGAYLFKLTVTHTDASTSSDTVLVSTQTQTKVTDSIHSKLKGYLESLPVGYDESCETRYPLLICLHGNGEIGEGTSTDLDKVDNVGVAKLISEGNFPNSFTFNNQEYSFIVISPQITEESSSATVVEGVKVLLDSVLQRYKVDIRRVYMTGLSQGGGVAKRFSKDYPSFLAAVLPIAGTYNADAPASLGTSNLPCFMVHNFSDPTVGWSWSDRWRDTYNALTPAPNPIARLKSPMLSTHDAWTDTYNPSTLLDATNSLTAYQWLLQYTNDTLSANAGPDQTIVLPTSSTTLDGGNSLARAGRCSTYAWSKISGPSATITSASSASTTVTGLSEGVYEFELTVLHTNGVTTKKDTVKVTVTSASPRQAQPAVNALPAIEPSKEMLDMQLNPNPVRNQVTVFVKGKATGNVTLSLYTLQGQRINQQQFNKPSEHTVSRNMQVGSLPTGAYLIQVLVDGHKRIVQFIKQ